MILLPWTADIGRVVLVVFLFNETATPEIYTLSLHDALPILAVGLYGEHVARLHALAVEMDRAGTAVARVAPDHGPGLDRKSTRLNSSHSQISYAVFCLKKKNQLILVLLIWSDEVQSCPHSLRSSMP